jgi:hypothetical protein
MLQEFCTGWAYVILLNKRPGGQTFESIGGKEIGCGDTVPPGSVCPDP